MRKLEYNTYKRNRCAYCTECKDQYYCKHDKCIYLPEPKKYKGYPAQAMFRRVI